MNLSNQCAVFDTEPHAENDAKPLAGSEENTPRVNPLNLAPPRDRLGSRSAYPSEAATAAFDCQYLYGASSRAQNLGHPSILGGGHADIAGEEVGESALGRKAKVEPDVGYLGFGRNQRVQRALHDERIQIEIWRYAGLGAEQPIEMGPRETGFTRNRIELDFGAGTLGYQFDGFAHAEVVDPRDLCLLRPLGLLPTLFVTNLDQASQLAVQMGQRRGVADQSRGPSDVLIKPCGAFEMVATKAEL